MINMTFPTIAALATAVGNGALHIIRVSGNDCFEIVNKIVKKPIIKQANHVELNWIIDDHQQEIDQVILVKFCAPNSFTGEDLIEINCHGNMIIVQTILELLIKNGAMMAERGEFSKRAFLANKIDLNQANAILGLAEAKTLEQVKGAAYNLTGKNSNLLHH